MSTAVMFEEQDATYDTKTPSLPRSDAGSAQGEAPTEKPVYLTVEEFVAHVIYDGRFLSTFTSEPEGVAELLGVALAPDVLEGVRDRNRIHLLAEATEKMTQEYGERKQITDPVLPDIVADIGGTIVVAIVIGGGAIAITAIVCIATAQAHVVEDHSSNADLKL